VGCWKWFSGILKEAEITVTDANRSRIDKFIHDYIGEKTRYEHCSSEWSKMGKKIREDENEKKKLAAKLKVALQ